MSFELTFRSAQAKPFDAGVLGELAEVALKEGREDLALPLLARGLEKSPTATLWQWKGLLERAIDEHADALDSFANAARLDPGDATIAHGRARVAMEAGIDARDLYRHARTLAPRNGQLIIGLAAAMAAMGKADEGAKELRTALEASPLWLAGYEALAQQLATSGRGEEATEALEQALLVRPRNRQLWETLLSIQLRRGDYQSLGGLVDRAEATGIQSPEFAIYRAIHDAEYSTETFPPRLFARTAPEVEAELGRWRIRHLLKVGAPYAALPLVDHEIRRNATGEIWAYAGTTWRMAHDPRLEWLEGDSALVSVIDLTDQLPPLEQLAAALRKLHVAKGEYLDQSVRGGTQTDGPLFCRIDSVIRHLRSAVVDAVERHIAQLPAPDQRHPVLSRPRDRRIRFSGSWSVRLRSGGRHSNHIHPLGWISSALYVALPTRTEGDSEDAGWFTLGEPDSLLGLDLPPWRKVEPKPGTLVLFPSIMWHGTVPFREGERLTVAFDVAPPR